MDKSNPNKDWAGWERRVKKYAKRKHERKNLPITPNQAREALWRRGHIARFKLDTNQLDIYEQFKKCEARKFVLNCSRRMGKTYLCALIAVEHCLQHENAQVRFAAPTARQVKKALLPNVREILIDCPKDLRPRFNAQEQIFYFPSTGSELHIAGTDRGTDNLRGTGTDLGIVDEAGFVGGLRYVIGDILFPQTLTTGGKILMASTPPDTMDHPFIDYIRQAKEEGAYVHRTIFDNPRLTKDLMDSCIKEAGGRNSVTFRREYMAELIMDEGRSIIPEFSERKKAKIIQKWDRPKYFQSYVGMDLGFVDLTAVVFGYWDFAEAKLIIEDEYITNRTTTTLIKQGVSAKEDRLWGPESEEGGTCVGVRRVVDASSLELAELNANDTEGRPWGAARKDDKLASINALRLAITDERIIIHPRCKSLIAHLSHGIWNKKKTDFARSERHGHYDCIDALRYMWRSVDRDSNPFPTESPKGTFVDYRKKSAPQTTAFLSNMMKRRYGR